MQLLYLPIRMVRRYQIVEFRRANPKWALVTEQIGCPFCLVGPGVLCHTTSANRQPTMYHQRRLNAAR
jgi:hypothetical protein